MSFLKSASLIAATLAVAPLASAAVYSFQDGVNGYDATQDMTIYPGSDSQKNTGGSGAIYVGYGAKALLRFDNLGALAGQTIQSATLTVYTSANSYGTVGQTHPVSIYAMEDANVGWQQGTGQYPDDADPGEACYDYLSFDTIPWPAPTALQFWTTDGMLSTLDTQAFTYQTDGLPVVFTLPVSLVQQWVNGTNPGLIVDSTEYTNGVQFQSSEYGSASGRPLLTVEAIPEPSSAAAMALGAGLLALRRRK